VGSLNDHWTLPAAVSRVEKSVISRHDDAVHGHMLSITCADRAGLLFAVAEILMRHDVERLCAKIDTLGERVEDTFLIRGEALQSPAIMQALEAEILTCCSNQAGREMRPRFLRARG